MQTTPLPVYPWLHVQVKLPGVLVHVALESQLLVVALAHSSILSVSKNHEQGRYETVSRKGSSGCSGRESGMRRSSDHAFESYYETLGMIVTSTTSHDPVQNCVEGVASSQALLFNYDCGGGARLVHKNIAKP